jgi:hypothetical protein
LNALRDMGAEEITGLGASQHDTDLGRFIQTIEQVKLASVGMHGRNAPLTRESIKETINGFRNSPAAVLAEIQTAADSGQNFIDQATSHRLYGTWVPPERRKEIVNNWYTTHNKQPPGAPAGGATGSNITITLPNGGTLSIPASAKGAFDLLTKPKTENGGLPEQRQ